MELISSRSSACAAILAAAFLFVSPGGAQETKAAAPAAVVAGQASGPTVRMVFRSPFGAGTVFLRMNGKEVLRRTFDFDRRKGGLLEANVELPVRSGELRAWVFSADGLVRSYAATRLELAEGDLRSVVLGLDRSQKLSVSLE